MSLALSATSKAIHESLLNIITPTKLLSGPITNLLLFCFTKPFIKLNPLDFILIKESSTIIKSIPPIAHSVSKKVNINGTETTCTIAIVFYCDTYSHSILQECSQDFFEGGSDLKWKVLREGLGTSTRPYLDENDAYTKCALM